MALRLRSSIAAVLSAVKDGNCLFHGQERGVLWRPRGSEQSWGNSATLSSRDEIKWFIQLWQIVCGVRKSCCPTWASVWTHIWWWLCKPNRIYLNLRVPGLKDWFWLFWSTHFEKLRKYIGVFVHETCCSLYVPIVTWSFERHQLQVWRQWTTPFASFMGSWVATLHCTHCLFWLETSVMEWLA